MSDIVKQILKAGYGPENMKQNFAEEQKKDPTVPVTPHEKAIAEYANKQNQQQTAEEQSFVPFAFYDKAKEMYGEAPTKTKEHADMEKNQKRNALFASIGDAFSAFSNAYARARGIQPYVNPGESLTGKMRERYDRLEKEYQARKDAYNGIMLNALAKDMTRADSWQQFKENMRLSRERMEQADRHHQDQMDIYRDRLDEQHDYNQGRLKNQKDANDIKRNKGTNPNKTVETETWTDKNGVKHTRRHSGSGQQQGGNGGSGTNNSGFFNT